MAAVRDAVAQVGVIAQLATCTDASRALAGARTLVDSTMATALALSDAVSATGTSEERTAVNDVVQSVIRVARQLSAVGDGGDGGAPIEYESSGVHENGDSGDGALPPPSSSRYRGDDGGGHSSGGGSSRSSAKHSRRRDRNGHNTEAQLRAPPLHARHAPPTGISGPPSSAAPRGPCLRVT